MTAWPSKSARELLKVPFKAGWSVKRQAGSHRVLFHQASVRTIVFAFHDGDEIGPKMVARISKQAGLTLADF